MEGGGSFSHVEQEVITKRRRKRTDRAADRASSWTSS